jgi:hypothetical protein
MNNHFVHHLVTVLGQTNSIVRIDFRLTLHLIHRHPTYTLYMGSDHRRGILAQMTLY